MILGIIPARGGSKGIPGKNIKVIGGKPLIAWTIEAALASRRLDRLIVSSDDEAILRVAATYSREIPFIRPFELAADDTPGIDPVLHALEHFSSAAIVVLLQPTSPLRTAHDIDEAVNLCLKDESTPSVVSVCMARSSPYLSYTIDSQREMQPILPISGAKRRQDLPATYCLNGAIYVARVPALQGSRSFMMPGTRPYVMPAERSVDIDDMFDCFIADALLSRNTQEQNLTHEKS